MSKVSVIMPSLNQSPFLESAIASVRNQDTSCPVEHILLDAGSNDGSVEIIKKYSGWFAYWRSIPDDGQSAAINEGMNRASGEVLCWINSDDGLADGAIEAMSTALDGIKGPAWAYGGCVVIDEQGFQTAYRDVPPIEDVGDLVGLHNELMQPAVFWNRAMWEQSGGLDSSLHYVMDYDLWFRFISIAPPIKVKVPIGVHRVHERAKTEAGRVALYNEMFTVLRRNLSADSKLYKRALRLAVQDVTHHANASMFSIDRRRCVAFLAMAMREAPFAFVNRSSMKALLKFFNPFQPNKALIVMDR